SEGLGLGASDAVTNLAVDAGGRIWAAAPMPGVLLIVAPDGRLVRRMTGLGYLWRAVPRADGSFWGLVLHSQSQTITNQVRLYDSTASRFSRVSLSPVLDTVNAASGQAWFAAMPNDGLAVTYLWSDRVALVSAKGRVRVYRGIERREFPAMRSKATGLKVSGGAVTRVVVDSTARIASLAASVDGDRLYVLFGGLRGAAGDHRTVDAYRLTDGRYLASYRLPENATALVVHHGVFILSVDTPAPAVKLWSWVPKP
ncbi:MAG: hypothetical protein ACREND_03460, partial [Gemmatimonadaceae bacterium]